MYIRALITALFSFLTLTSGQTQTKESVELGRALLCSSPQFLEKFVQLEINLKDSLAALRAVNESVSDSVACTFAMAVVDFEGIVGHVRDLDGPKDIVRVNLRMVYTVHGFIEVGPLTRYMLRQPPGIPV